MAEHAQDNIPKPFLTQAMIDAGVDAYARYNPDCDTLEEFLTSAFTAMLRASVASGGSNCVASSTRLSV